MSPACTGNTPSLLTARFRDVSFDGHDLDPLQPQPEPEKEEEDQGRMKLANGDSLEGEVSSIEEGLITLFGHRPGQLKIGARSRQPRLGQKIGIPVVNGLKGLPVGIHSFHRSPDLLLSIGFVDDAVRRT